jgi:hypothetical protein
VVLIAGGLVAARIFHTWPFLEKDGKPEKDPKADAAVKPEAPPKK